jgi:hypothetical protein
MLLKVAFKKNTPKSPIAELNKLKPNTLFKIDYKENEEDKSFEALFEMDSEIYIGNGTSKNAAKKSAFKKAIRALSPNKNIIFF